MTDPQLERLREAFATAGPQDGPSDSCPSADRIWAAAAGELPPSEVEALVDHVGECPWCAYTWRSAVQMGAAEQEPAVVARRRIFPVKRVVAGALALAAGVALVVLGPRLLAPDDGPGEYRAADGPQLEDASAARLSRQEPILRWRGAPAGSLYDVTVTTPELEPVARATGLEQPEFHLPDEALSALPAGARLHWTATARLPAGEGTLSATFVAVVE